MTEAVGVGVVVDESALKAAARWWWVDLLMGIVSVAAGIAAIVWPDITILALVIIIALAFLLNGIGDLAVSSRWGSNMWVPILWGVLSIAAGIVAVVWPSITVWALVLVIGIALIVRGLIRIVGALSGRPHLYGLWALAGLVELAIGILAIAWPNITLWAVAVIIGIDLILVGLAAIVLSIQEKKFADA